MYRGRSGIHAQKLNPSGRSRGHAPRCFSRVDSFEAGEIEGWGSLFVYTGASVRLALNCYHDVLEDRETLEVWHNRARRVIELSRKQNGFGDYLAAPLTVPGRPIEVQGSVDHGVTEVNLHFLSAPRAHSSARAETPNGN